MNSDSANSNAESLILETQLSEISRIPLWVNELSRLHGIPDRTRFAMDLCLEEAVSNIIRHNRPSELSGTVKIRFLPDRGGFIALIVEDMAPPFNPLLVPDPVFPRSLDDVSSGGQGIHLLRQFAEAVEYEVLPKGNRLTLSFPLAEVARPNPNR